MTSAIELVDVDKSYRSGRRVKHVVGGCTLSIVEDAFNVIIGPSGAGKSTLVRLIAQQYSFVPECIVVPEKMPVTFRGTATDAIHGFVVGRSNANTMLIPGFVATFTTTFPQAGEQLMPCHEYCGTGHEAMWARVKVISQQEFLARTRNESRLSCVQG